MIKIYCTVFILRLGEYDNVVEKNCNFEYHFTSLLNIRISQDH